MSCIYFKVIEPNIINVFKWDVVFRIVLVWNMVFFELLVVLVDFIDKSIIFI